MSWLTMLCIAIGILNAQIGRSGLTGTITDPGGAAAPDVKVTATNEATGLTWATYTSSSGAYSIPNIPAGMYTVTAEASGFQKSHAEHVSTEVDKISTLDIKLVLGAVTQSVQVEGAAPLLNTTSGTIGNLVTTKEIETLPLNGRSWISLNYLTPGAVKFRGTSSAFSNITASVAPGNFVVNGLRGGDNQYYLDAVSLENSHDKILGILPPVDALQEFRTQSGNMTAEFMGGASAVVSGTIKSGTNALHGTLWEYLRNDVLDARGFFDTQTPPFRRNQFGGAVGGPIRKNRTFFFGSYEGFRQVRSDTAIGDYPTAAQRSGNLSDFSGRIVDPLTGQPFAGNLVPANRINSLSTSWLDKYIPLPNRNLPIGSGNFLRLVPRPINYNTYIGRIDHRFSEKSSMFGRYIYTDTNSVQHLLAPTTFNREQKQPNHNLSLTYTRIFNPNLIAEGRFGYQRYFHAEPVGSDTPINFLAELGVLGKPGFTEDQNSQLAPPRVSVTGFSQFGHSFFGRPREYFNSHFFYQGSVFLTRGAHSIKMGGGVIRHRANFPETINPTGSWTYDGTFSGSPFADFLLGYPRSIGTSIDQFTQDNRSWGGGLWFQDDWKISPKLTFNLGLRWDVDGRYESKNGRISNYDLSNPPTAVLITPDNPQFPRPKGWTRALIDTPVYLWSPRVGLAYRALSNTVVRGGYGIYWQPMSTDGPATISLNPPWIRSVNATYDITNLDSFDRSNPLVASSATAIGAFAIQKDFKDSYVQQWNLSLEQTVGSNLFSIGYVGNKGTHLITFANPNLAPPGPGPINPRRPYTNVGGISYYESSRASDYQGLHLKAQRRFSKGFLFTVAYAFGKVIDTGSGTYIESRNDVFQQPRNPAAERGLAEFDVRHTFTASYVFELPFGRGRPWLSNVGGVGGKFVSGWQALGITRLYTGSPVTVTNSFDNLNNGGTGYPNAICNPNLSGDRSTEEKISRFFDTSCFVRPPLYTFGNSGRNTVIGPGTQLWDFSLIKDTAIAEGKNLEFRAEFFNIFNHPNFDFPNTAFGTPQFGSIRSTSEPAREIQLGLKFIF